MKNLTKYVVLAFGIMLLCGCSQDYIKVDDVQGDDDAIVFSMRESRTRGLTPVTTASLDRIGVYAKFSQTDNETFDTKNFYIKNAQFDKDVADGLFKSSPVYFWPVAGELSFFAYTPYKSNPDAFVSPEDLSSFTPRFTWTTNADVALQEDLCTAVKKDQHKQVPSMPMEFHHALSKICFSANYIKLDAFRYIVIDTIWLRGLIGTKKVTVKSEEPYNEWEKDTRLPRTAVYELGTDSLHTAQGEIVPVKLPLAADYPDGVNITNDNGVMYMIPQTLTKSELAVNYTVWYENPAMHIGPIVLVKRKITTPMPVDTWESGTEYRYLITVNDDDNKVEAHQIESYISEDAFFYASTCVINPLSMTATVGSDTTLTVTVGPDMISDVCKEVDWSVEPAGIIEIKNISSDTRTITVHCLAVGTCTLKATTRIATSDAAKISSICNFTVIGKGLGIPPYTTTPFSW